MNLNTPWNWDCKLRYLPTNTQELKEDNPKEFPNIIFDYGGVIINIDVQKTIEAFLNIIPKNMDNIQEKIESSEVFQALERGEVEEPDFLNQINGILGSQMKWEEFEPAWNAMIGDIPADRLKVLERVSKNHRIFLLSNTNSIHLRRVNEVVKETMQADSIDHYFEKAYYSNHIGLRKPGIEIYNHVLTEQNLDPEETIFLDDNILNLKGAAKTGMAVYHITEAKGITDIF